jgi:SAM-dependent methyltransferase
VIPGVTVSVCMDTEGPCADPGNPELLGTWEQVDEAMDKLFEPAFRDRYPDPGGGRLAIGWFFLAWSGFTTNPRSRAFGYHAVRDHYVERWGNAIEAFGDEHCWHYHHPPASGIGNEWGLDWETSDEYARILSRQLLERRWFPACYRAGGTIMDSRSSRFVDSWFPLDFTNRAPLTLPGLVDWSGGVAEWGLYHPSPEDFRMPGAGRRRMARCLDLLTGVHVLGEEDVVSAFERARRGLPALLSVFEHDYRDIEGRLDGFRELLASVAARYPDVDWRYAAPRAAVLRYLDVPPPRPLLLEASPTADGLAIWTSEPVFQSVPWLAARTPDGEVRHVEEGLVRVDPCRWRWTASGLEWDELAVGASTDLGETAVAIAGETPRIRRHPQRPHSIWEHSDLFAASVVERASGRAPEMDAARQAAEILAERLAPPASVLDVGCAGGHLYHSLRPLRFDYFGIDEHRRSIELGRLALEDAGLPASHLRALPVEWLPADERHDAVVSLSTLLYLPRFELPLEIMARAARRLLVVRSSFGESGETRYLPDVLLDDGFESLHAYFNVYARDEVAALLERLGFRVEWQEDRRQRESFGGAPEVVGGIELSYEFLVAERVAPSPEGEDALDAARAAALRDWREGRAGGPGR